MFALGGCSESDGGSGAGPDGKVAVSFVLPGIGVETEVGGTAVASDVSAGGVVGGLASGGVACSGVPATRTGTAVALDEGVTVRIVAYKEGSTLANSTSDVYVDEATYVAAKVNDGTGEKIVLKPCTVTLDANGKVASFSESGAKPLYLFPGTYDFYAITPAFASSDHKSVSVAHGDDFASSKTANVEVKFGGTIEQGGSANPGKGDVTLTTLDRKCSKIVFDVDRKSETAFDKLQIVSVKMTKMTKSPVALKTFTDDIYTSTVAADSYIYDNNDEFTFPESAFKKGTASGMDADYPYQWTVESPVLPKKSDKFGIELQVRFGNDTGTNKDATTLTTTADQIDQIGALHFLPDVRYTFKLKLKGNGIQLILSIGNWETPAGSWSDPDGIGGYPPTYIVIGTWEDCIEWTDDSDIGGFLSPEFTGPGNWEPNHSWSTDLGAYLESLTASGFLSWDKVDGDTGNLGTFIENVDASNSTDWESGSSWSDPDGIG